MTTQGKSDAMRSSEAQAALDALSELENAMGRAIIQWGAAYGRIDVSKAVQALAKESGIEADMATLRHEGTTRVLALAASLLAATGSERDFRIMLELKALAKEEANENTTAELTGMIVRLTSKDTDRRDR